MARSFLMSYPVYRALADLPDRGGDAVDAMLRRRGDTHETVRVKLDEAGIRGLDRAVRALPPALREQHRKDFRRTQTSARSNPEDPMAPGHFEIAVLIYAVEPDRANELVGIGTGVFRTTVDGDALAMFGTYTDEWVAREVYGYLAAVLDRDADRYTIAMLYFESPTTPWAQVVQEEGEGEISEWFARGSERLNPHRRRVAFPPGVGRPRPMSFVPPGFEDPDQGNDDDVGDDGDDGAESPAERLLQNPDEPRDLHGAVQSYEDFHLRDHRRVNRFPGPRGVPIPETMALAGPCKWVTYKSDKWDEGTHDYVHNIASFPDVKCAVPVSRMRDAPTVRIPARVRDAVTVAQIGLRALGFAIIDADGNELEGRIGRGAKWYWSPTARALYCIEGGSLQCVIWGGKLNIEPRGIVG